MNFNLITAHDLDELRKLQPEGWPDIIPETEFYIRSSFCFPLKVETDNCIAGMGVAIIYDNSAWLAHIIVLPEFRKSGIGLRIVSELLHILECHHIHSCLLIATELGRPVYTRAGFRPVTEYIFMNRKSSMQPSSFSKNIVSYNENFRQQLLQMDKLVTGENREPLLSLFLNEALLFVSNGMMEGYFIPALKEGPVVAVQPEAGLELLKIKCATAERVVLPADNQAGIGFLMQNGFVQSDVKGTRMIMGKNIMWQPDCIYSRIGGNFG
jgi:GNAT superfamily N-acetyltransferase